MAAWKRCSKKGSMEITGSLRCQICFRTVVDHVEERSGLWISTWSNVCHASIITTVENPVSLRIFSETLLRWNYRVTFSIRTRKNQVWNICKSHGWSNHVSMTVTQPIRWRAMAAPPPDLHATFISFRRNHSGWKGRLRMTCVCLDPEWLGAMHVRYNPRQLWARRVH